MPAEPTVIEKLWIEGQAAKREYEVNARLCKRLEKVLERRMPDPHPSIVWGNPENDADGLKYWVPDCDPPHFKKYKSETQGMVKSLNLIETKPILLGAK